MSLPWQVVLVFLGAGCGGVLRFLLVLGLDQRFANRSGSLSPGTILANLAGSIAIGLAMRYCVHEAARTLVVIGLLGGFTTFSAFSWQTWELYLLGRPGLAAINVLLSVLVCLLGVAGGEWLGRQFG